MNDAAAPHAETGAPAVPVELRVEAFALDTPGPLATTSFYRIEYHYRGSKTLADAYLALWLDPDLGNPLDDYVGSDVELDMGFVYNGLPEDLPGYGDSPPALGITPLEGPNAEFDGLDNDQDQQIDEAGERRRLYSISRMTILRTR